MASCSEAAASAGFSIFLDLPGKRECITVRSSDFGSKVWSDLRTLSAVHRFKLDGLQCLRPDGKLLALDEELSSQGLREGSILLIREQPRTRKHETVVLETEDLHDMLSGTKSSIEPHLWRREEREGKALHLKQKANDTMKEGAYAVARELYSTALAWLPPDDSDLELVAALFGNRALAHMKLERWEDVKADAIKSLELVPSNSKVQYRLGMAHKALGAFKAAEECFQAMLEKDPDDRVARQALASMHSMQASLLKATHAEATPKTEKAVPKGLQWRLALWRHGYTLQRLQHTWRDLYTGTSASSSGNKFSLDHTACLSHAWRHQEPLKDFFLNAILKLSKAGSLSITVLGTGSMAAVMACSEVSSKAEIKKVTVVEPSQRLIRMAEDLTKQRSNALDFVQAPGQLDTEFAIPIPSSLGTSDAAMCLLVCDRIAEDLVGERLIATMKAGRQAAAAKGYSNIIALPARAELICAPLEFRCVECCGFDTSKANALRFTAHSQEVPPAASAGARVWKCEVCSWRNVSQVKACELCRAVRREISGMEQKRSRKQDSSGWWPVDLDTEAKRADLNGSVCHLAAEAQVVCSFDFNESIFEEQQRVLEKTFEAQALQNGHVNAVAVWWRLYDIHGTHSIEAGPDLTSHDKVNGLGPSKRQAIFYLGYEVGVEKHETLRFHVHFSDTLSRIHFEMLEPRLVDRMGLMKFEVDIVNEQVLAELQSKLDTKSNRLTAPIAGTPLKRRDKLLSFGPFDLIPGTMSEEVWKKVKDRLERHSQRPKRGDQPIRCVFQHGVFEGTRRWPIPTLADGAIVPRQTSFFEHFGLFSIQPYLELLESLSLLSWFDI